MERRAEKSLTAVVETTDPLQRLLRAQRIFDALDQKIQPVLSDATRGNVFVARVHGSTLVLAARSPAWASRARLEAQSALQAARTVWPEALDNVQVIVSPGLG